MRPLIVVSLIFIAACSYPGESHSTRAGQRAARPDTEAVPVSTALVSEKPVPLDVPADGTVEAISSVQIRAQVAGQLGAIHFAEGQDVTRGQLLFELDPRPFELALAQAEAVLAKDAAQNANVGDLVRANDTAPMVVINQMSPINVTFAVPGRLLDDIRRYQAAVPLNVEAVMNEPGGRQPSGHITFIDNAVDQATGTIKLKALFDNADRRLWPGEFVNVNLQLTTEPHAVVTPASAVQTGQNGTSAYIVRPNRTVEMRPVKVARIAGAESVIASGLQPGETVVTDGQLRLTPGARVTVHGWPVATTGATR